MPIPTAPVLNNNKSIDYFNELSTQQHLLSQQTIYLPHKKKEMARKRKGDEQEKEEKEF